MDGSYRSLRFEQFEPKLLLAGNQAPLVDAGRDLELPVSDVATLEGTVSDDGPLDAIDLAWVKVRGPGEVTFADSGAAQTTAQFSALGRYDVRLEANDGEFTTNDYLTINVLAASQGPVVDAGADQTALVATDVLLRGSVTGEGSPDSLMTTWVSVSGPSLVRFADPGAEITSARFSVPGIYVLQLEADDGEVKGIDQVTITVEAPNTAPQVDAGTDQTVLTTDGAVLDATVADDGLPESPGSVTTAWSKLSGPGTVAFGDASAVDTTVTFSESGTYVLRLEASDGQFVSYDEVTLTVETPPTPPPNPTSEPVTREFQDGVFPQTAYSGTRDATITSNSSSANFGFVTTLDVDGNPDEATLLRWDVSQIPPGSVIQSAAISINLSDTTVSEIEIYELLRDWDEGQVTWQQPRGGSPWQTSGAQGSADRGSSVLGGVVAPAPGPITFELTSAGIDAVQSWVNNSATNFGVIIQDYDNYDGIAFASREASTQAARPKLTVTYLANGNPGTNLAPIVDAGPDRSILVSSVLDLDGDVRDDRLPESPGTLVTQWRKISGPGDVHFADASAVDTTASFTDVGTYVLELSANDGELTGSEQVRVNVSETAQQDVSGFFVSPNGSPNGDGSADSPWDLRTALSHPNSVQPGDTIWLRQGTYRGGFTSRLKGTAEAPIVVSAYPGERATIDIYDSSNRTRFNVDGDYSHFVGLEFMSSDPKSRVATKPGQPEENDRGSLFNNGSHNKLINLVLHNLHLGVGQWADGAGGEIYGSIIFNNGWLGPDRAHGHGIYAQNLDGTLRIADNVVFGNYGEGIIAYGNSEQFVRGFQIEGNASFNNGLQRDLLVGAGSPAERISVVQNYTYQQQRNGEVLFGWTASGDKDLTIQDNYFASGDLRFSTAWSNVASSGNKVIDTLKGPVPSNGINVLSGPTGLEVFVRPNEYEAGRANVIIYNWDENATVDVDLSSVLAVGATYEVRHVYDIFGESVVSGVYQGDTIQLPMRTVSTPRPTGNAEANFPTVMGPEFGVFVVTTVSPAPAQLLAATCTPALTTPIMNVLSPESLEVIAEQAIGEWRGANLGDAQVETLQHVSFRIADLDGPVLAQTNRQVITLDSDAFGHGWFIDETPNRNDEFTAHSESEFKANEDGPASGRMDLLTVVMHELGHVLGFDHDTGHAVSTGLMTESLGPGVRRVLDNSALDEFFGNEY